MEATTNVTTMIAKPSRLAALVVAAVLVAATTAAADAQSAAPAETNGSVAAPAESANPAPPVPLAAAPVAPTIGSLAPEPRDLSPWGMFMTATLVVKAVMTCLMLASVATWTVALAKGLGLLFAKRELRTQIDALARSATLAEAIGRLRGQAALEAPALAAAREIDMSSDLVSAAGIKERIASRLERLEAAAGRRIARATGVLATTGAIGPFVGLFGTVWGIMNSFVGISKQHTTNLAVVAPGIAEALLATAMGLVAAIPAVVIYNLFSRSIAGYRALYGDGTAEILRLASRDLDRSAQTARVAKAPYAAE
ncbi:MAG TPA: tonB-system energizer ExbB [Roseiarcus sp.]|jgi:biopolymer transport protein ExbB